MAIPSTLVDRVKIFTTSSGTGPFTLGEAVPAFRGVEALTNGLIYSYAAENGADFEVGQGQFVSDTNQLIRTVFESSLGAGAPVPFPANVAVNFTALAIDLSGAGSATEAAASAAAAAMSAESAFESATHSADSAAAAGTSETNAANSADAAASDADDAQAAATAAAASAAIVGIPSYSNTLGFAGQGDRTATAVVSDLGTLAFNTGTTITDWSKLIDGTLAGKTPVLFVRAGAVAGKIIGVFPKPSQLPWFRTGTLRTRQANTVNNGTWEPVIFRGVTFDADGKVLSAAQTIAVGAPVLWNVATLEFPISAIASLPCEGYGWRGVSGSAAGSGVSTGLFQIEAQTLTTDGYGRRVLPTPATAGQIPVISGSGQSTLIDPNEPPGRSLLNHLWLCNEGHGTVVRDQVGGVDFTLVPTAGRCDIAAGGSIAWEEGELVLRNAAIATASTVLAQTIFYVYQSEVDQNQYAIAHVSNDVFLNTVARGNSTAQAALPKLKMLHSIGINNPVLNGASSPGMQGFASGGTSAALMGRAAAATGAIILNALRNDTWGGRIASPLRPLMIATMPGVATSDEAQAVQNFLDWHMFRRGRVLTGKYATKRCGVALFTGESTHHTSLRMDTDPTLAANPTLRKNFYDTFLSVAAGPNASGTMKPLQRLTYYTDQISPDLGFQLGNEGRVGTTGTDGDRNSKMGPAFGFAEKDRYRPTRKEYPIFICKVATGGTCIAPFGSARVSGGTLTLVQTYAPDNAVNGSTLSSSVECQGWSKFEADLRRQGYGVDFITRYDARGLNDAALLTAAVFGGDPAVPQGWLQASHDRLKSFIGVTFLPTKSLVPHLPIPGAPETYAAQLGQPGVTGYPNNAAGQVEFDNLLYFRAGNRLFDTANADVEGVEGDYYGTNITNGDSVHMPLGTIPGFSGASFSANLVAGNTSINVTNVALGALAVGQVVFGANIVPGTTISALGTGTGGTGTYTLSNAATAGVGNAKLAAGLPGMYVYGGDCNLRFYFDSKVSPLYDLA